MGISEQFSPVGHSNSVATKESDEPLRLKVQRGDRAQTAKEVHSYQLRLWCVPHSQEASDEAAVEA